MGKCTIKYGDRTWEEEASGAVSIKYNGIEIGSVAPGDSRVLNCAGKFMRGSLKIGNKIFNCLRTIMRYNVDITHAADAYVIFENGEWRGIYEEGSMCGWYGLSGTGDLGDNNYFESNVRVYGTGSSSSNCTTGYIVVCYNTSSKNNSTGFDFGKYSKIGVTLTMKGTAGLAPGGVGYADSVTGYIGNATLTSASNLGLTSGVEKTITVDISGVTGKKFIVIRSPYLSGSYVDISKIWLE